MALLIAASLAPAADAPSSEEEIAHLIRQLGASGCRFNRNGTWYSAERAVSHLKRKYEYLNKRGLVPDAETFIARAASESSASGQPYLVQCSNDAAVPSATWLRAELQRYRNLAPSR